MKPENVVKIVPATDVAKTPAVATASTPSPDAKPRVVWLYEKHEKIYPRSVQGWFAKWRWVLVWLTQAVFYGLPWLPWNGRQAVLFDLGARRFFIFDLVLYPQDFIFLTGLLILSAYALFFFTSIGGRLWCGYACPQTVYTEIFLWIERKFEGERGARQKLDRSAWSLERVARKGGKQLAWIAFAWWTGFTFVGYFTPIRALWGEAFTLSFGPWEWFWVNFYALATYGNAGFLREQVCKYMCPYARFQGAMFDRDTMIVSYDVKRGEPRGTRARGTDLAAAHLGHCIDCGLCVQVCPVGIDIRKGLQYECTACTACIDACNGVMEKMHYPKGLIRYATENGLENGWTTRQMFARIFRPRILVYATFLVAISAAFVTGLSLRSPIKVDVVRDRASLARLVEDGQVENVYRLQIMNATEAGQHGHITVDGIPGAQVAANADVELLPAEGRWVTLRVRVPAEDAERLGPGVHPIQFQVATANASIRPVVEKSTFIVPR